MDICDAALVCAAWNVKEAERESVRHVYIFFQEQICEICDNTVFGKFHGFSRSIFQIWTVFLSYSEMV